MVEGEDDGTEHQAVLDNKGAQINQYVYGVNTPAISTNELVQKIQYPDKTTGQPSTNPADQETLAYNAQEQAGQIDRNGSRHSYSYDVLGRTSADKIPILGAGVDGAVRRLETAYDTGGRPYLLTSLDSP